MFFLLPLRREARYQLEVADDPRRIVQILTAALGALLQPMLADVAAIPAQRIRHVEREVVAAGSDRHVQQEPVLLLREMLLQIDVAGGAAVQVLRERPAVQLQFVLHVDAGILHAEEVAVVAVAGHIQLAPLIPRGVLHAQSLGRDELGVPKNARLAPRPAIRFVDRLQYRFRVGDVLGVFRGNVDAQSFRALNKAVDADGQILLVQRDEVRVVNRQQTGRLPFLQNLIEGQEVLVELLHLNGHRLAHIVQPLVPDGFLHQAIDVDGHHALAARGDAASPQRVGEGVVLQLVPQAAAGALGIHRVRAVDEKAVPLRPHLRGKVRPFGIDVAIAVVQQVQRLHGECQNLAPAFLVEPAHEPLLQPVHGVPAHGRTVREHEVLEHASEIGVIEISDVPEDALVAPRRGRLIQRVNHLLKRIGDHLINAALSRGEIRLRVGVEVVFVAILLADVIIEIAEPLGGRNGSAELAGQRENQIDERAVEGREIPRRFAGATDGRVAAEQEGIERHAGAVGFAHDCRLVMAVNFVLLQLAQILLGDVRAVHLLELAVHGEAVDGDGVALVDLGLQRSDVLLFDVGIGIHLAAGGGVQRGAVAGDEVLVVSVVLVLVNSHVRSSFLSATQARPDNSSGHHQREAWGDA